MTFEVEMAALGRATAGLLLESDRVPATALRTAEVAQIAQFLLLHEVHRDLVGSTRMPVRIENIEQHPVAVLGRILQSTARVQHDLTTFDEWRRAMVDGR